MTEIVSTPINHWQPGQRASSSLIDALERGNIVYFPNLKFDAAEQFQNLCNSSVLRSNQRYISLEPHSQQLRGHKSHSLELQRLLNAYQCHSAALMRHYFPCYQNSISLGHTCFIPAKQTQPSLPVGLHIDAFPSTPLHGKRILRLFTNISPDGKAKAWQLGEPFNLVMERFAKHIKKPLLLKLLLTRRSFYDHVMLQINRMMKSDQNYQAELPASHIEFPAASSWLAFTDQISHASSNEQHVLSQTFYLPISSLNNPQYSPLTQLERYLDYALT